MQLLHPSCFSLWLCRGQRRFRWHRLIRVRPGTYCCLETGSSCWCGCPLPAESHRETRWFLVLEKPVVGTRIWVCFLHLLVATAASGWSLERSPRPPPYLFLLRGALEPKYAGFSINETPMIWQSVTWTSTSSCKQNESKRVSFQNRHVNSIQQESKLISTTCLLTLNTRHVLKMLRKTSWVSSPHNRDENNPRPYSIFAGFELQPPRSPDLNLLDIYLWVHLKPYCIELQLKMYNSGKHFWCLFNHSQRPRNPSEIATVHFRRVHACTDSGGVNVEYLLGTVTT